jgi:hypothetical protein
MKKHPFLITLFISILSYSSFCQLPDIDIIKFGAVADGKTNNTVIIQNAIDACSYAGGGVVHFPAGTYLSGSISIKDNVTLHLHKLANLKGIGDINAYPDSRSSTFPRKMSFIHIDDVSNVSIIGEGTIDGNGGHEAFQMGNNGGPRPFLIQAFNSRNIVIKDVNLINAAFWTVQLVENDGVRIDGVRIYSLNNWNNDGIDIDSKNVIISNCIIDCDDDAICFKSSDFSGSMVENVVITNCIIGSNCNFIKFGMSKVGFRDVTISNCVLRPAAESNFRFWENKTSGVTEPKTGLSGIALEIIDGGIMEQITISNINMRGIQTPVFIRLQQGRPRCVECMEKPVGSLKNILISNIVATASSRIASSITGIPGHYVENITIRDMIVNCMGGGTMEDVYREIPERENHYPDNWMFYTTLPGSVLRHANLPAYGLYVRHAKNINLENVQFNLMQPDYRPAIFFDNAHDVTLRGFKASLPLDGQELIIQKQSTVEVLR